MPLSSELDGDGGRGGGAIGTGPATLGGQGTAGIGDFGTAGAFAVCFAGAFALAFAALLNPALGSDSEATATSTMGGGAFAPTIR